MRTKTATMEKTAEVQEVEFGLPMDTSQSHELDLWLTMPTASPRLDNGRDVFRQLWDIQGNLPVIDFGPKAGSLMSVIVDLGVSGKPRAYTVNADRVNTMEELRGMQVIAKSPNTRTMIEEQIHSLQDQGIREYGTYADSVKAWYLHAYHTLTQVLETCATNDGVPLQFTSIKPGVTKVVNVIHVTSDIFEDQEEAPQTTTRVRSPREDGHRSTKEIFKDAYQKAEKAWYADSKNTNHSYPGILRSELQAALDDERGHHTGTNFGASQGVEPIPGSKPVRFRII